MYVLERFRSKLVRVAAQLRRETWGGTQEQNERYLRWKYLENPYIEDPMLFLVLDGNRAVGMRGLYGTCWEVAATGARYVFPALADTTVLPAHRQAGLFAMLGHACIDGARSAGFTHLVNPTSGVNALGDILTFGWRPGPSQGLMVRRHTSARKNSVLPLSGAQRLTRACLHRTRTESLARRVIGRSVSRAQGGGSFSNLDAATVSQREGAVRVDLAPPVDVIQELARGADLNHPLRPVRDPEFLGWRFGDPFVAHRFLTLEAPSGAAVVSLSRGESQPVMIIDWLGTSPQAKTAALRSALRLLGPREVAIWAGSLPPDEVTELAALGFVEVHPEGVRQRYLQRMLVRPTSAAVTNAGFELAGVRLDSADAWGLHALTTDIY